MTPVRDLVLVRPSLSEQTRAGVRTDGSRFELIVPSVAQRERTYGRVLAIGPDVKHVTVGSNVLYDPSACIRVTDDAIAAIGRASSGNIPGAKPGQLLVAEASILAIIEE